MDSTGSTRRKVASYYDDFARTYSGQRRAGYFGFVNELETSIIIGEVAGKRVLEIGCGTGLILDMVALNEPAQLTGVDLSPGMLRDAKVSGHAVVNGSVLALPFRNDTFDIAYSFKVLPHVPDLRLALEEAMRVVADGGIFFAELYNPLSFKGILDRLRGAAKKVYLRHDLPAQVRASAPSGYVVECVAGVRIFGPAHWCYTGRLGGFFRKLDRAAMRTWWKYFAGYQIYAIRKLGDKV